MAKGLYDSQEMCTDLIVDCNDLVKHMASGQYVLWCATLSNMARKLALLRDGIRDDNKHRQETIDWLKSLLRERGVEVDDVKNGDIASSDIHRVQVVEEGADDGSNRDMV